jgi:hypothetical protein
MSANQATRQLKQRPSSPRVSILGVLFFLLGMPHIYQVFSRKVNLPKVQSGLPYGRLVMAAAVLAILLELSMVPR